MPLYATRKNGQLFSFTHGGESFDFDFVVKDPKTIEHFLDYPNAAVVRTKDGEIGDGEISSGQWIQVDHKGESAYLTLNTSGYDRLVIEFDAPLSFVVRKDS